MANVKKRNPILIMVVIMMIFVIAIFATQLFWPAKLDKSTGKVSRFGGGGSDDENVKLSANNTPDMRVVSDSDDPDTAPIE